MFNHSTVCMGDSLSHNYIYGLNLSDLYPAKLQSKLRSAGASVGVRNLGRAGDNTQEMIDRFGSTTLFGVPDIAIVYAGINDPGDSFTQATTQANLETMIQTLKDAGCSKIIVCTIHFMNFTTGGDFDGSDNPKIDTASTYASVIAAQKAAQTSKNVVLCDLYNFFRNRIVNGQDVKHSASWHLAGTNIHFNANGCDLVAQALLATIQAQGWDKLLV